MKNIAVILVTLMLLSSFVLQFSAPVKAQTTIYVPDDYATIQAAINAATPGETIIVRNGTYAEDVVVNKTGLTIMSENGPANCIIKPSVSGFRIESPGITINGFTVTGSSSYQITIGGTGGNVIVNNIIKDGTTHGIIAVNIDVNNNFIANNTIVNNQWNIAMFGSHNVIINNKVLNSSEHGIITWLDTTNNTISNNIISGSGDRGIQVMWGATDTVITNNIITSTEQDGIKLEHDTTNVIISNNTITDSGGNGILLSPSSINAVITNNVISGSSQNGIQLQSASTSNLIMNNKALANKGEGIVLADTANDNLIYLNSFKSAAAGKSSNNWNSPSQLTYLYNGAFHTNYLGNYWADYGGSDADGDGVGDTPYGVNSDNDTYPLMASFENYVIPDIMVPDDYPTIQAAINAANVGDAIVVRDGTYNEDVLVNKRVRLFSEKGPANCIVQATTNGFRIESPGVIISGFTVTGGSSYLIVIGSTGNNSITNNIVKDGSSHGILVSSDAHNNLIANNIVMNNKEWGIGIFSNYNVLENNNVTSNGQHGIITGEDTTNNTISNNVISGNGDSGIQLMPGVSNTIITGNTISSTTNNGIILYNNASSNKILNNLISGSGANGIQLMPGARNNLIADNNITANANSGILISGGSSNTISSNFISGSGQSGIQLRSGSNNNLIKNNAVLTNKGYGIAVSESNGNTIYLNNFDNGTSDSSNTWNSPSTLTYKYGGVEHVGYLGNYWADYGGSDANGDGVGDTPYSIGGETDDYPLMFTWEAIYDEIPPIAVAGPDQTVNEDIVVFFDGSGSRDNVGIYSYTWTFMDMTTKTLTGVNPNYTFATPGIYVITLEVTDPTGNSATDSLNVTVNDITAPVPSITVSAETVSMNTEVVFDASDSSDNVGIVSCQWDFRDGNTATGVTASYTFKNRGTYIVTLTVTDAAGNSATDTITITVELLPWEQPWFMGSVTGIIIAIVVAATILKKRAK